MKINYYNEHNHELQYQNFCAIIEHCCHESCSLFFIFQDQWSSLSNISCDNQLNAQNHFLWLNWQGWQGFSTYFKSILPQNPSKFFATIWFALKSLSRFSVLENRNCARWTVERLHGDDPVVNLLWWCSCLRASAATDFDWFGAHGKTVDNYHHLRNKSQNQWTLKKMSTELVAKHFKCSNDCAWLA